MKDYDCAFVKTKYFAEKDVREKGKDDLRNLVFSTTLTLLLASAVASFSSFSPACAQQLCARYLTLSAPKYYVGLVDSARMNESLATKSAILAGMASLVEKAWAHGIKRNRRKGALFQSVFGEHKIRLLEMRFDELAPFEKGKDHASQLQAFHVFDFSRICHDFK